MLEDEETIDYGEDELIAPVTGQDEVSLTLEEPALSDEATANVTPEKEAEEGPATPQDGDGAKANEAPIGSSAPSDQDVAGRDEVDIGESEGIFAGATEAQAQESHLAAVSADGAEPDTAAPSSTAEHKDGDKRRVTNDSNRREATNDRKRDDSSELAPGWRAIQSRSGGEQYYYNERTGESCWSKPTVASQSRDRAPQLGSRSGEDARDVSASGADQPKKKKKKKPKRARDAAKADVAAAAAKQFSSQRGRDARDRGHDNGRQRQQEAGRKDASPAPKDTVKAEQGFSIKGSAQRKPDPSDSKPADGAASKQQHGNQRSNGSQQRQDEGGAKRKRGDGGQENAQGRGRGDPNQAASKGDGEVSAAAEKKRLRTDRDDRGKDASRLVSAWSGDTPRDTRMGDSWRPSGDSARGASRNADESRRDDRRDAPSSGDRKREAAPAASSDRRRDTDIRDRDRDRRDDRGRDRERERGLDQRQASRNEGRSTADKPTTGSGASDRVLSDNRRNGERNGNRNDRDAKDGRGQQQRQAGSKGQPRELSSINSTNSQNKRQWGGAASS